MAVLKSVVKKWVIAMVGSLLIICAGTALLSGLVLNETIGEEAVPYGLYLVLLLAGAVSAVIAGKEKKLIMLAVGLLSPLCIVLVLNAAVCEGGLRNIPVTAAALLSGSCIPVLIGPKKNSMSMKRKNYKMVNLYKKQSVGK